MNTTVEVWEEDVWLPTYGIGQPEKNPMFFEKRVYQGSSGVVYPYPVIEKIEDTCEEQLYRAVYLENEYLKIMVLPQLGGRIQMAYDKIKQRHFIYYNQVIKPALVGLTGPWISGGIEFNWPQHHRPSTFLPVDYTIEKCSDGSAVVWVSERERMFHQKGMAGFTLRPGHAYLEIQGKLYNPTPVPQTFLWWANPAVAVNEAYQSVFPTDVNAVFDHGKRDVSTYPIATGTYYKMDYSAGVDISRYKNIPVPTSYMAIRSDYNFVGGYENDTRAGLLHVANHHISPGKKQWTWGNGDFGQAWDRNLTDVDGPYIELMTGVYTDNQPDFTWLQPYEEKTFTQYFMPYRELGVVKNACADLLLNIEPEAAGKACLKLFATSLQKDLQVVVKEAEVVRLDVVVTVAPEEVFTTMVDVADWEQVEVIIQRSTGKSLLEWKAEPQTVKPIPEPAKPALPPREVCSVEQLYLTGLHLEQYRHATYSATDYYEEALRRDYTDVRANNAMGLWLIRKGQFTQAEPYLRRAVETLTERNPNPYDGEPYYNLGLCLKYQGRSKEAYDAFYKACWNGAWQDSGYYALAQLSSAQGEWEDALQEIDRSLIRNWHNHRARHLKSTILRHLDRKEEAHNLIEESLRLDQFNFGCRLEAYLLSGGDEQLLNQTTLLMRDESANYEELVVDYLQAGCFREALEVIGVAEKTLSLVSPMLFYYQAWCFYQIGEMNDAFEAVNRAETNAPDLFFPNTLEALIALQTLSEWSEVKPARALYLLGNIWYDKRQYDQAVNAWERSVCLDDQQPGAWRNLALAYYNKKGLVQKAVEALELAFELDQSDARILMELDQLYKRLNRSCLDRLSFLDKHIEVALSRDDLYLEYVTLLNLTGAYERAICLIDEHVFHPWEGGEGKVPAQYQYARVRLAQQHLQEQRYEEALVLINECFFYPHHLGEGKLYGARENDFFYYKGVILEAMGQTDLAKACFEQAAAGDYGLSAAMYYNDQKADKIYYQGLALQKLGCEMEDRQKFNRLIAYGEKHLFDRFTMDYFAVSLPDLQIWEDDMTQKNSLLCNYLMGLGHLGLGDQVRSQACFNEVLRLDQSFIFAV